MIETKRMKMITFRRPYNLNRLNLSSMQNIPNDLNQTKEILNLKLVV